MANQKRSPSRRKSPSTTTAEPATIPTPGSDDSAAPTPSSSASNPNPLGLEADTFDPPPEPVPADPSLEDIYEPPERELLEWTPERAGAIVRAGGFVLHTADGMAREPEGAELWRATEADVDAIAPPLSRILNRYAPARRLAGVSDEAELAIGLMGYARKNLADRGRVVTAKRQRDQAAEEAAGVDGPWPHEAAPPPEPE